MFNFDSNSESTNAFQHQHSISAVSPSIASATSNMTASTARQLCSNIGSSASAASPTTSANAAASWQVPENQSLGNPKIFAGIFFNSDKSAASISAARRLQSRSTENTLSAEVSLGSSASAAPIANSSFSQHLSKH
jgi:predicted Na+-dependent transporter